MALLIFGAFSGSGRAELLNFDFSITEDPKVGNVAGTITGEIIGLEGNPGSPTPIESIPEDIILTSIPSALGITLTPAAMGVTVLPGAAEPPWAYSLRRNDWNFGNNSSSFTVTDGNIAPGTDFIAALSSSTQVFGIFFGNGDTNGFQHISDRAGGGFTNLLLTNDDGFPGITYTPVTVPEPSEFAFFVMSAAMLLGLRRKFRLTC